MGYAGDVAITTAAIYNTQAQLCLNNLTQYNSSGEVCGTWEPVEGSTHSIAGTDPVSVLDEFLR